MAKELIKWNGRAQGNLRGIFYVAAYTQKQAAELIAKACGYLASDGSRFLSEIRIYYTKGSWGNPMDGITTNEPCVYHQTSYFTPPKRIL